MTSKRLFLAGVIAGLSWGVTLAEPFTQGNVVVSRVGGPDDEIDVIPDSAARVRLLEISVLDGSTVQEIRLPALASEVAGTNNRRLTLNTDFRAGMLKRSANGLFLTIGGYDADAKNGAIPGTFQVNRTPATEVNRVVARIDFLGSVDTTTAISTTAGQDPPGVYDSGANASFRCVVTDDGTNFWLAGRQGNSSSRKGRVQYVPYGGTESIQVPLAASNNFDNCRVVDIYNGQLYGTWNIDSPSNNLFRGVYSIGEGLPKEVGQPTLIVPNLYVDTPADSPYDFFFVDADTAYLTSDNVPADNGGVQKFVRDTDPESPTFGLLTYRYTLKEGLYPNQQALRAMTAAFNSETGFWDIYAITATNPSGGERGNSLVKVTDTGCPTGTEPGCEEPDTFTILSTAGDLEVYRGVALAPRPCEGEECIGACCQPGGTCEEGTPETCSAAGGIFRGVKTSCETTVCGLVCGTPFADADHDGDVDADDFGEFQRCFAGSNVQVEGQCRCFDRPEIDLPNGDGDVDQSDFNAFVNCATRATILADPDCGN